MDKEDKFYKNMTELVRNLAKVINDNEMLLHIGLMDLADKIMKRRKKDNKPKDVLACLNVLKQLEEMYDDLVKEDK